MSQANPLWGAPRIHGELLKLGIAVAQSTVARYFTSAPQAAFPNLVNLPDESSGADCVHRFSHRAMATFPVLFVFVVLSHERRRMVHFF